MKNNKSYPKSTITKIIVYALLFLGLNIIVAFIAPTAGVSPKTANLITSFGLCAYILYGYFLYYLYTKNIDGPAWEHWEKKKIYLVVKVFIFMFLAQWLINIIKISMLGNVETPTNQLLLEQMIHQKNFEAYAIIFYGGLLAPVVEEFLCRGILMNYFFKNSWWWANIILSGFVFALPHMLSETNFLQLSFILNYSLYMLMGCSLAYIYKKTGKMQYNILAHFVNNFPILLVLIVG